MIPLYGRSSRGSRVYDRVIRNYGENVSLLACIKLDEATFEAFMRKVLLLTLHPGQIVIMDNLSSHKTLTIERLIGEAGCQLLYLPAYLPDLSPIEEAFSQIKASLQRCRCQTIPEPIAAIERDLDKIPS